MRSFLYMSLMLAGALAIVFGAAAVLERQALQKRDARIETQQPAPPQAALRTGGMPASSKGRPQRTAATMDDGL